MKNYQNIRQAQYKKGIAPIIIALIVAVVLGGGYFMVKGYFTVAKVSIEEVPTSPETKAILDELNETASWKTYKNEKYGFEFQYPSYLGTPKDTTGQTEKIDCNSKGYSEVLMASSAYINVQLACPSAIDANPYRGNKKNVIVAGKNSFLFDYTSTVGYQNKEVYIPLNDNLYVSIGHSYKSGRSGYVELSAEDFKTLLSTVTFTK